jgi:hypothetical protein
MKFARVVFTVAGIWGIAVLLPFYWLVDLTGRRYPAPTEYPQFFYGFFAVALAWQIAFLVIGSRPDRYRSLMPLAVLEKFGFVGTLLVLYARGRISWLDAQAAAPDFVLGVLFVAAAVKMRRAAEPAPR